MIKTALIGFGKSAEIFHLPFLLCNPDYEIVSVLSSRPEMVKKRLPKVDVYSRLEDLLADDDLDLVIINTPNHLHYAQAKLALEAGKHVVIEKPFVLDLQQGEELIAFAKSKNLKLSVYHNRRWDSGFLTLKKLIDENSLGKIYSYEARFDRYRLDPKDTWREQDGLGTGTLFDLGSHLIDQALCLFGKPNEIITDIGKQRLESNTIDYFHLVMKYGSGLRVILHSGSVAPLPTSHLLVQGDRAGFVRYGMDSQEDMLKQGLLPNTESWGKDLESQSFLFRNANNQITKEEVPAIPGAYQDFYKILAGAVNDGGKVPVSAEEALEVVKTILAIKAKQQG